MTDGTGLKGTILNSQERSREKDAMERLAIPKAVFTNFFDSFMEDE
jgi:hypothetical protein